MTKRRAGDSVKLISDIIEIAKMKKKKKEELFLVTKGIKKDFDSMNHHFPFSFLKNMVLVKNFSYRQRFY